MRRLGLHGARPITRYIFNDIAQIFNILALGLRPRRDISRAMPTAQPPYVIEITHQK